MILKTLIAAVVIVMEVGSILAVPASILPAEINKCLSSNDHKHIPSPNEGPMQECKSWGNRSCCTNARVKKIHSDDVYMLKHNFCNGTVSKSCKKFFIKDTCFFECSPNVALWLEFNATLPYQRFKDVPMCKSDCDDWFNACSNDYTCFDNWYQNSLEDSQKNVCTMEIGCETIKSKFKTAKQFCEMVWDNSFKVIDNGELCMKLSFNNEDENRNDEVAMYYYKQHQSGKNSASDVQNNLIYMPITILILKYII